METSRINRRRFIQTSALSALAAGAPPSAFASGYERSPQGTSRHGQHTELFLDDEILDMTASITRKLHSPTKHPLNPVIRPEQWWEGYSAWPVATLYDQDDKLFKMWYRTGPWGWVDPIDGHASYAAYATSVDGVHWEKRKLGAVPLAGRKDHNVVLLGEGVEPRFAKQGRKAFFFSVVPHPYPKDENEKYVGLIFDMKKVGAYIGYSNDGIHWRQELEPFWQTPCDVAGWGDDSIMCLIYDKFKEKWVIYRRVNPQESEHLVANQRDAIFPIPDRGQRIMSYADSPDLKHWENHQIIMTPDGDDPSDVELYGLTCYNYADTYVGYLWIYHQDPDREDIDIQLTTSRDGIHFTRCCRREVFIPNGPYNYFDHMITVGNQPEPIIVNDTVYLYYEACNFKHTDQDEKRAHTVVTGGLATFTRDRFVSLETGMPEPCRIVTKPFIVQHPKLFVNAGVWGQGSIEVELLTRGWGAIPGYAANDSQAIKGNALNHPVRWKNKADLGPLVGQEVRLKFNMTDARLHAIYHDTNDRPLKALPALSASGASHAQLPVDR